jgi:hypothetical protein
MKSTSAKQRCHPVAMHLLLPNSLAAPRRYSLIFVIICALVACLLPRGKAVERREREPAFAVRIVAGDDGPLTLIDGNRDGRSVLFDHELHKEFVEDDPSCAACHHQNVGPSIASSCTACHRDMRISTDTFDHASHVRHHGGNQGCVECHTDPSVARNRETAKSCDQCHPGEKTGIAPGYTDALHSLCIKCHEDEEQDWGATPDNAALPETSCDACHEPWEEKE